MMHLFKLEHNLPIQDGTLEIENIYGGYKNLVDAVIVA
jgi:hypothetical protein